MYKYKSRSDVLISFKKDRMLFWYDPKKKITCLKLLVREKPRRKYAYYQFGREDFIRAVEELVKKTPQKILAKLDAYDISNKVQEEWIKQAVRDSKRRYK